MRVTIERKYETSGLIFKSTRHRVDVSVDFSEEERHVINSSGLRDFQFYNPPLYARLSGSSSLSDEEKQKIGVPVWSLLNETWTGKPQPGFRTACLATCETEALANVEEEKIREALKNLKAIIDRHSQSSKAKDTFEL